MQKLLMVYLLSIIGCTNGVVEKNNTLPQKSDREELGFSKEVKKVVIREKWCYEDNDEILKEENSYLFNKAGDELEFYFFRDEGNGMESKLIYSYDNGKKSECMSYKLGYDFRGKRYENIKYKTLCFYNDKGELTEEKTYEPVDNMEDKFYHYSSDYYYYNNRGQKVKEKKKIYQADPRSRTQVYGINYDYETIFKYDKRGNLVREFEKRPKPYHYKTRVTTYSYNEQNQLIKEFTVYQRDTEKDAYIDSFFYDTAGRLIKNISYSREYDYNKRIYKYSYDENNRIKSEVAYYMKNGLLELDDYEKNIYEYDSLGNKQEIKELFLIGYGTIKKSTFKEDDYEFGINVRNTYEYEYWK